MLLNNKNFPELQNEFALESELNNPTVDKNKEALETFLYHSSHEMRSPLTSILGIANLIKYEKDSNINRVQAYVSMIEERANHMASLLKDLANITYNSASIVSASNVDLENELKTVLQEFNHVIDVSFFYKIKGERKDVTDATRLRIILRNLISNSIKFRDKSKTSFVDISFNSQIGGIRICVEDNGIGIASDHMSKIFNPYYKVEGSMQGNGLGLYLVREIVDKLKGKIEIASTPLVGTQVNVWLPKS